MCGIVGIVSLKRPVDRDALVRMRDALRHRGPDSAGEWVAADGAVGLAHRRLRILDLTAAGHQPMTDAAEQTWIVFNGEIYNFQILRRELEAAGYTFRSTGDTEVLLNAYRHWGTDCLARLNGMWAFAIWDAARRQLFFARDRVGKKPLYYSHTPGRLSIASQATALALDPAVDFSLDLPALNSYLALGYIPGEQCVVRPSRKLPPAHAAVYDVAGDTLKTWRYWQPPAAPAPGAMAEADGGALVDELESLLGESVRMRLISDVPLGVLLSGGVDSSLVTALAARHCRGRIRTFTIRFPGDARYDEGPYARRVAQHFATDHLEIEAAPATLGLLPELAAYFDEPLADSSLLPTYLVSRLTREHVTVALGGDGGDELFGGYSHYPQNLRLQQKWHWVPSAFWRGMASAARRLPPGLKGRNFGLSLAGGPLQRQIHGTPYFDVDLRRRLFRLDVLGELGGALDAPERWLAERWSLGTGALDRMTRLDFLSYLPDDILMKVDRASMALALEVRAPWLDVALMEFAFRAVPAEWKVQGATRRRLQRALAQRLLPPDLDLDRKQGLSIPMDRWLREPSGIALLNDCLLAKEALPWFRREAIETLIAGELKGRANGARLFALLMLAHVVSRLRDLGVGGG